MYVGLSSALLCRALGRVIGSGSSHQAVPHVGQNCLTGSPQHAWRLPHSNLMDNWRGSGTWALEDFARHFQALAGSSSVGRISEYRRRAGDRRKGLIPRCILRNGMNIQFLNILRNSMGMNMRAKGTHSCGGKLLAGNRLRTTDIQNGTVCASLASAELLAGFCGLGHTSE